MKNGERGQVMLIVVVFFTAITLTLVFGTLSPIIRYLRIATDFHSSKQSYFAAEAAADDAYYRLRTDRAISFPAVLAVSTATATVTRTLLGSNEAELLSKGDSKSIIRIIKQNLTAGSGVAFNYGIQVGEGGLKLRNTASVVGNVYSNGRIDGENKNQNMIYGDVVSAGSSGKISEVHATSSAFAHEIKNSIIDRDAHYQEISGTAVGGVSYPNSPDEAMQPLPISDETIDEWESDAASGGTITSPCPYKIDDDTVIGPKKINCDLEISGSPTITLTGSIWARGKITFKNSPEIRVSPSLGSRSVVMIAHDTNDKKTSSDIKIQNSARFYGNGQTGSYVLLVARNDSALDGGDLDAIHVENSVSGDLLIYAPEGNITLQNSVSLKEVTGYKITLKNSAKVTYASGISSLLFSAGPSGSWKVKSSRETY